jgi:hypothetical protein
MPKIRDILTDSSPANLGLIPYLAEKLGGEWDRFQLRNYDFRSPELLAGGSDCGFRWGLVKWQRKEDNRVFINREIKIGYQLTLTDQLELQIAAAEFNDKLAQTISTWSCCTDWAKELIVETDGNYAYSPNPTISSGNPGGWFITVVVEFELIYETAIGF